MVCSAGLNFRGFKKKGYQGLSPISTYQRVGRSAPTALEASQHQFVTTAVAAAVKLQLSGAAPQRFGGSGDATGICLYSLDRRCLEAASPQAEVSCAGWTDYTPMFTEFAVEVGQDDFWV